MLLPSLPERKLKRNTMLGAAIVGLASAFTLNYAIAEESEDTLPDVRVIEERLMLNSAGVRLEEINETPIPGIYQISIGNEIVYTTATGDYLFRGDILHFPGNNQPPVDITEQARSGTYATLINSIDPDTTIIYETEGEPRHILTKFVDVTCPYCARMHDEIDELVANGIQVNLAAYPRGPVNTQAFDLAIQLWCSDDQHQTVEDLYANRNVTLNTDCNTQAITETILEHKDIAEQLGLRGTPMSVSNSGVKIDGYRPAADVIELLQ